MKTKAKNYPPFSVRMSEDLHKILEARINQSGRSKNAEIVYLLKQVCALDHKRLESV